MLNDCVLLKLYQFYFFTLFKILLYIYIYMYINYYFTLTYLLILTGLKYKKCDMLYDYILLVVF